MDGVRRESGFDRSRTIRRFDFDVNQGDPTQRIACRIFDNRFPGSKLRHEIEDMAIPSGRIVQQFRIEPFDGGEVESLGPILEEQFQKLREEQTDQRLEALIVIFGNENVMVHFISMP